MKPSFLLSLRAMTACALTGALFQWLHTPLPWMMGPLAAMAALKFAGVHLSAPQGGREFGQLVIACALGLYFTPAVAGEVLSHWPLLILAAGFAVGLSYLSAFFLFRFADIDRTTAFFASVPGGAAEMTNLGERFGAQTDRIAIAQALRIVFVVVIVPVAMTMANVHGSDIYQPSSVGFNPAGLSLLLFCAAVAAFVFRFFGVPNAWMLGALAVSVGLTVSEHAFSAVPAPLTNLAQLLIGCSLGTRFEQKFLRSAPRFLVAVSASIFVSLLISALFGVAIARLDGLAVPTLILATAPGGIAEMCITAKVLQLGVPLVTAAHVTRVIILVTSTAPLFRFAKRVAARL
jgi:membrane AbrB-like protein